MDTDELEPGHAEKLQDIVKRIGFLDLPAELPHGRIFDPFNYTVTIAEDGREHAVGFVEEPHADDDARRGLVELTRVLVDAGFEFGNQRR